MSELPKAYEPQNYEDVIYKRWEESGFFDPDNLSGEPFSIMFPPPNVTGVLHLGHALENSLMDTMARYQRMLGKKVLLLPGTDHAAVATQAKVESLLVKQGMKHPREELGRDGLLEKIREYADNSKSTILSQIRAMGTSCDWSRLAYTFDETRNRAVNEVFVKMYNDNLIYRGYRVVNWSVKGQSTCSDDELVYVERPGKLYYFKYAADFPITIATTRPETKLGDTAVAVHPDDVRYQHLIGQKFLVEIGAEKPLTIHIIADTGIDPNFGTGALGVTPAHSPIDFEMYLREKANGNDIGLIPVIGEDGCMTRAAGVAYAGLTVEEARAKFVQYLRDQNLLEKEEDTVQNVGTSDRFKDVVEPLPKTQWFVDVNKIIPDRNKTLKDLMREAVSLGEEKIPGKIKITPERFEKQYFNWIGNLRDWCISRQIWWGHRIPVWYHDECQYLGEQRQDTTIVGVYEMKPIVSNEPPKKCPNCGSDLITEGDKINCSQDPDTLDTWFSSGMWTFSTLGWPERTQDFKDFHPSSWMQMGYEILFFWMARMVLMSTYALGEIPFHDVYIHGMVRDEHGQKFSKSAGNGVDPIEVIKEYGCDALRWSLMSGISPGNDMRFFDEKIEGARNFVNKLWNISRYILLNISEPKKDSAQPAPKTLADQWILSRLNETIKIVTENIEKYNFSYAGEVLRDFTWNDLADWYLEITKIEGDKSDILGFILNTILKLWHPYMPFVTETIWQEVYGGDAMLMVEKWPQVMTIEMSRDFSVVQTIITGIRATRAEHKIEPVKLITAYIKTGEVYDWLEETAAIIRGLARIESLTIATELEKPANSVGFVEHGVEVYIDLSGVVDTAKEKTRIEKEIATVAPYVESLKKKLGNQEFVQNAPPAVVAIEQKKLAEAEEKLGKYEEQLSSLSK